MSVGLSAEIYAYGFTKTPEFRAWRDENMRILKGAFKMVPTDDTLTEWTAEMRTGTPGVHVTATVKTTPARPEWLMEIS